MLPLIIGAAAPIIGSALGNLFGAGDREEAERLMNEAMQEIDRVGAPPDLSKEILLEKFTQAGLYTPELESAIDAGVSKVAQIQEDPELRKSQMGALDILQQRGKGGLTPEDRAALNQVRGEVQRDSEAKRQQIMQNMQARGLGGSGAELIAQLQGAQAGTDRASEEGDRLAAMSSQNALQALMQGSNLAGSVRGQDFDVNQARAAAEDEINRFNVQNAIARQSRNVGSQNQAQMQNLSEKQRIADANNQMANAERYRQAEAQRQQWLDKMSQAQAKAGAKQSQASNLQGQAAQTAQMGQSIGAGIGAGAGAYANYQAGVDQRTHDAEQRDLDRKAYGAKRTPASPEKYGPGF